VTAPLRVLLLGATSEIGTAIVQALALAPGSDVILAARDSAAAAMFAKTLPPSVTTAVEHFDARQPDTVAAVVEAAFARGAVDIVIPAFGQLGDEPTFEQRPADADELLAVNVVAQIRALLESARRLRAQGHGTIVVLSSVAAVRPRRGKVVYGTSKAALDAAARALTDSLTDTGVRVLLVRPGFVTGRMTAGMQPAPLATTPDRVAAAVVAGLAGSRSVVWVPPALRYLAMVLRLVPRPIWRRLRR
jgi:decaprenylphospho-beta-D-erythro-pentofuranosid-2-ulose 2-reductase